MEKSDFLCRNGDRISLEFLCDLLLPFTTHLATLIAFIFLCLALPLFVQVPKNETVSFGKSAVIHCKAAADTDVTISWLKDGQPFTVKQTETRIFIFKTSVFIADVRYSDSGKFTCKATNEAGSVQSSAYLRVLGKRIPRKL